MTIIVTMGKTMAIVGVCLRHGRDAPNELYRNHGWTEGYHYLLSAGGMILMFYIPTMGKTMAIVGVCLRHSIASKKFYCNYG